MKKLQLLTVIGLLGISSIYCADAKCDCCNKDKMAMKSMSEGKKDSHSSLGHKNKKIYDKLSNKDKNKVDEEIKNGKDANEAVSDISEKNKNEEKVD